MSTLALKRRLFTGEEYLTIERKAPYKSEYVDGEIYAMVGAGAAHITITTNITIEAGFLLKGTPCQGMANEMKVMFGENGL